MRRVLIYGAGEAGVMVLKEIIKRPAENISVLGFIDDNGMKLGSLIEGIEVLGGRAVLRKVIREHSVNEVIIAMPSIGKPIIKQIVRVCRSEKVKLLIVPSTREIIEGTVRFHQLKEIDLSDLLEREEVRIEGERIREYIQSRTVLVTGAAGSIGSALVKKICNYNPSGIVMLDSNENALFYLLGDVERSGIEERAPVVPVVSDIKELQLVADVFEQYKPDLVFHTAAYKHVPLMEQNIRMTYLNNVIGTYNVLTLADIHGVGRFIGISTDKAVYPVSVMGKTKRVCEIMVQAHAEKGLHASSVRFGNVIGSNGSVITVFKEQIRKGGPLTITSPDMSRYFMTVDEATSLVLQAGTMNEYGGVFVLDMGRPIMIKDLAENLIILSGLTPGTDVEIQYTGIRPGEKINEELFYRDKFVRGVFSGIYVEEDVMPSPSVLEYIESSLEFIHSMEDDEILRMMDEIIEYSSNRKKAVSPLF